jgi:diacylglycerol kinase (ATP)
LRLRFIAATIRPSFRHPDHTRAAAVAKTCLLLNSAAGSAAVAAETIREFVDRRQIPVRDAAQFGDAARLMQEVLHAGFERVIVAGGDGTIAQTVAALAPDFSRLELGIVPLGTGNDLARSLSIDAANLPAALEIAADGAARPIDLVQIEGGGPLSYLVNVASGGVAGKVAADVDADDKQLLGPFAYWLTAIGELADLQPYHVQLDLDNRRVELDLYGVYLANGRYVGGGFAVAPDALLDDGLLDVTAVPALSAWELLAAGMRITLGGNARDERLPRFRASRVHLVAEPDMHFSVDGEPTRAIEATLEVLPGALRIVPGPNAEALMPADGP